MEVAALVSGINPSINAMSDSIEVACLQQVCIIIYFIFVFLSQKI